MKPFQGTLCGSVVIIDCCLKRSYLKGRFEMTYIAPTNVLIRDLNDDHRINIQSKKGNSIEDIKVFI